MWDIFLIVTVGSSFLSPPPISTQHYNSTLSKVPNSQLLISGLDELAVHPGLDPVFAHDDSERDKVSQSSCVVCD